MYCLKRESVKESGVNAVTKFEAEPCWANQLTDQLNHSTDRLLLQLEHQSVAPNTHTHTHIFDLDIITKCRPIKVVNESVWVYKCQTSM